MTPPISIASSPDILLESGAYRVRLARDARDLDAVLRLRYEVFNLELGEGLEESHATGRDRDPFDAVCHHLLVLDAGGAVIGTYRAQTMEMARASGRGFYTDGIFDLSLLPGSVLEESIEVGRACIARGHRNRRVLFLLWKGLAAYVVATGKPSLFGCCSLTSQDPAEGRRTLRHLRKEGHLHPVLTTRPRPGWECDLSGEDEGMTAEVVLPPLFQIYLRHGGKAVGSPAIDRQFKTIDFLVLLDTRTMPADAHATFFGDR